MQRRFHTTRVQGRTARRRDESGLAAFYDNYASRALFVARHILSDEAAVEAVVAEGFLDVWRESERDLNVASGSRLLRAVHENAIRLRGTAEGGREGRTNR
jgi:DNA-directed RNA polymerase specialized sigma24 family protein